MRIPDSSAVVRHDVRNLVRADGLVDDLAQLEASLLLVDGVGHVLALDVPEHSEVLASSLDRDDVHEAERVLAVSADLAVDLDETFLVLADLDHLLVGEGVLQTLSQQNGDRNALSQLVRSGSWSVSISSRELVKHPVGGGGHALHVFLRSSSLNRVRRCLPFLRLIRY